MWSGFIIIYWLHVTSGSKVQAELLVIPIASLLLFVICYFATPELPEYMLNSIIHV